MLLLVIIMDLSWGFCFLSNFSGFPRPGFYSTG
uniref:Uncharacterized protein n=1 Tax=Rhizophora mucronata TaxID=61149 RepID=A0A2P2NBG1_RHIMU